MELALSGLLMTLGISGMHYVGMEAMMIGITYNNTNFVMLSIAVTVSASAIALFYSVRINWSAGHGTSWAVRLLWGLELLECSTKGGDSFSLPFHQCSQ